MKTKITTFIILLALIAACQVGTHSSETKDLNAELASSKAIPTKEAPQNASTIQSRIAPPSGYIRTTEVKGSFQDYLRSLELKPEGSVVKHFDGSSKTNNVYHSVIDLDIGNKDLHQCADAIMRLRAEHLWNQKKYNEIHFNFTNGFKVDYSEWMKGRRMVVKGNKTYWNDRDAPANTYDDFWQYLELIFMYAGTASLEKELKPVPIQEAEIGDVLIQGGHPGHAVIIVDKAVSEAGNSIYLLAQSYMPAQEIQVLNNRNNSQINPWYELQEGSIYTPEWSFTSENLKRFP